MNISVISNVMLPVVKCTFIPVIMIEMYLKNIIYEIKNLVSLYLPVLMNILVLYKYFCNFNLCCSKSKHTKTLSNSSDLVAGYVNILSSKFDRLEQYSVSIS